MPQLSNMAALNFGYSQFSFCATVLHFHFTSFVFFPANIQQLLQAPLLLRGLEENANE